MLEALFRALRPKARSFAASDGGPYEGEIAAFDDWLDLIRQGRLAPLAPRVSELGQPISPLQFWGQRALDGHVSPARFLAALPELIELGLPIDHFNAYGENDKPRVSASSRPLSHLAIAHRGGYGALFLRALLDLGADPNSRDAYGAPALALCRVAPRSIELALELWDLLIERGADPTATLWLPESEEGGRVRAAADSALPYLSLPTVLDLAGARVFPLSQNFLAQAHARAQAREIGLSARSPDPIRADRPPAFL